MDDSEQQQIERRALNLLANREHSRAELRRKLLTREVDPQQVDALLNRLERNGTLSDQRFTEAYVSSRRRRGFGPLRIEPELRERGVGQPLIEQWLDADDPDWEARLREVAAAKFGRTPAADYREQVKRARYLEYRGFSHAQIRRLLWDA